MTDREDRRARVRSTEDDVFPQRIVHDFRIVAKAEAVHDPVFVECHRACREIENGSGLFHRPPLRKQL